jgi:hypothetical protein
LLESCSVLHCCCGCLLQLPVAAVACCLMLRLLVAAVGSALAVALGFSNFGKFLVGFLDLLSRDLNIDVELIGLETVESLEFLTFMTSLEFCCSVGAVVDLMAVRWCCGWCSGLYCGFGTAVSCTALLLGCLLRLLVAAVAGCLRLLVA